LTACRQQGSYSTCYLFSSPNASKHSGRPFYWSDLPGFLPACLAFCLPGFLPACLPACLPDWAAAPRPPCGGIGPRMISHAVGERIPEIRSLVWFGAGKDFAGWGKGVPEWMARPACCGQFLVAAAWLGQWPEPFQVPIVHNSDYRTLERGRFRGGFWRLTDGSEAARGRFTR
jgi:hypothetical protein